MSDLSSFYDETSNLSDALASQEADYTSLQGIPAGGDGGGGGGGDFFASLGSFFAPIVSGVVRDNGGIPGITNRYGQYPITPAQTRTVPVNAAQYTNPTYGAPQQGIKTPLGTFSPMTIAIAFVLLILLEKR